MATSRDAPNPLRPYYIPPSIGLPPDLPQNQTSHTHSYNSRSPKPSFGSHARDILSDLDYDSYFPDSSPTLAEHAKRLVDQALWNYTSVLLAQPFEVAKTILQVHMATGQAPPGLSVNGDDFKSRPSSFASGKFEDYPSDESDDDSPSYFTSTAPRVPSPTRSPERRRARQAPSRSDASTPTQPPPAAFRRLELRKSDSLLEVISQLWQKESAWGVWKGTNATFIYNFLLKTSESWTRSFLSALLNVPDPGLMGASASGFGGLDIIDSPSPLMSLAVAVAASAVAAVVLAPLDLVRTRLIVTPTSAPPRTIWPSLSLLPTFSIAPGLLPVTLLHSTIPTFISSCTPLVLRSTLAIDPVITPSMYSISTFLSSTVELFVRLPLETVLRRGQVAILDEYENQRLSDTYQNGVTKSPVFGMENEDPSVRSFRTIVEPGPYRGIFGTIWFVVRDEGVTISGPGAAAAAKQPQGAGGRAPGFSSRTRIRKGQGVNGLWRGWRVGFWGLVGVWGAAAMGAGGGEF
ncbi:mitochondrial carrier [Aaosphaeria arxii CBS 175.79]|uniref:Mitochondrial carrier n=1 Tax=Aaosphaeria arxii CBS 175.79 TaxID=1450172 RepID=A0A6A5Y746_9PLEO|nr:mitochondrial carrier [Aaosphaeria arxii CBS 175.79]KAF2021358.1 mitochondrial carrier [Aaosphaeria arxii CBS 175.79]